MPDKGVPAAKAPMLPGVAGLNQSRVKLLSASTECDTLGAESGTIIDNKYNDYSLH